MTYLTPDALADALAVRDLTDPAQGPHAIQIGRASCRERV